MLVKIPGTTYVRDTKTMALINTDISGLEEYKVKSTLIKNQKEQINNVKVEIDNIKNDISDIKNLMVKLLEKG